MRKKGFIFLETISILMVVALSLTILLASYTLVYTKAKQHKYYDLPRDLYTLYAVANLVDTSSIGSDVVMVSNSSSCEMVDGKYTVLGVTIKNCGEFMNDTYFDNVTIEYLKTLPRCYEQKCTKTSPGRKYLLGIFKRQNKYYYASIEL